MTRNPATDPADTFGIAFDTMEAPGRLKVTMVTIRTEFVADTNRSFRVDLTAHPLYAQLVQYIMNNPPGITLPHPSGVPPHRPR